MATIEEDILGGEYERLLVGRKPAKGKALDISAVPDVPEEDPLEAEYLRLLQKNQLETKGGSRVYLDTIAKTNPDAHAKVLNTAEQSKVPVEVAGRNMDMLGARNRGDEVEAQVKDSPSLKRFMGNPDNAKIAHDDLDSLSAADKTINPRPEGEANWVDAIKEVVDKPSKLVPFVGATIELVEMAQIAHEFKKLEERELSKLEEEQFQKDVKAGRIPLQALPGEVRPGISERDPDIDKLKAARVYQDKTTFPELTEEESLQLLSDFIAKHDKKTTFGYDVTQILSHLPAFMGEFVLTGGAYTVGKTVGRKAIVKSLEKVIAEKGRSAITKKAGELGIKIGAGVVGATVQTIPAMAPRILTKTIEETLPEAKFTRTESNEVKIMLGAAGDDLLPALAKGLGHSWVEMLSERSGGLFSIVGGAGKKAATETAIKFGIMKAAIKANPKQGVAGFKKLLDRAGWHGIINEVLEERAGEVGRAALGLEEYRLPTGRQLATELVAFSIPGAGFAVAGQTAESIGAARVAKRKGQTLRDLGTQLQGSKLLERSSRVFEEAVNTMAGDTALGDIRLSTAGWDTYWQGQKVDPREAAEEVFGSTDIYDDAVDNKEDMAMTLGAYVRDIGVTEHNEHFSDEVVFTIEQPDETLIDEEFHLPSDEMSGIEASKILEAEEAALAEQQAETAALFETELDRIETDPVSQAVETLTEQFEATGQLTREESELHSEAIFGSLFRAMSAREGIAAEQLISEFAIRAETKAEVEAEVRFDTLLDRIREGDLPTEAQARGESLLEFLSRIGGVKDEGKELAGMDADKWHRGQPFRKKLVSDTGLGLDDAVLSAWDSGFFPTHTERPDINEFLEAIGKELGGEIQYSEQNISEEDVDFLREVEDIERALEAADIDISEATNEEVIAKLFGEELFQGEPTFVPKEIAESELPDTTVDLLPSHSSRGEYYYATSAQLKRYVDEHGDGFLYRVAHVNGISEGYEYGDPGYKHTFKEAQRKVKVLSFTTSMEDAQNYLAKQEGKGYIVYRIDPRDLSDDFTIQIPSERKLTGVLKGEMLHVQSPRPASTRVMDVIYRDGKWEERTPDDSRRVIDQWRTEADRRGLSGLREDVRRGRQEGAGGISERVKELFQEGKRARVRFHPETGEAAIALFEASDLSSLIHEAGHIYYNVISGLAGREGASAGIKKDFATFSKWLGVKPGEAITEAQLEQFARGYEAYLREGRAPSVELRSAFATFRSWLVGVYRTIRGLNVTLTPEVREAFARMMATQEDMDVALPEMGEAVADLVAEGRELKKITSAEVRKLVPAYKGALIRKVKGLVKDDAALEQVLTAIEEDKVLFGEFTKASQASHKAFGVAGKEKALAEAKTKIAKIHEKAAAKVDKILTEKHKMDRRRQQIKAITTYLNLTDAQVKKLMRGRSLQLMSNWDFKQFKDNMLLEAERIQESDFARQRVRRVIEDKRLEKTENYQRALGLPALSKMTTAQMNMYADLLTAFHEGDVFLTQRKLEVIDRVDLLKGARTWREVREAFAKEAGIPLKDLPELKIDWMDELRWDTALAEKHPFFKLMVKDVTGALLTAEQTAFDIEAEFKKLWKASEKSRTRGISGRLLPQDPQIFDYLEITDKETREQMASEMTPEQVSLAEFMESYYVGALDYLLKVEALDKGREGYISHVRKTFFEVWKSDGLMKAVKGIFQTQKLLDQQFSILRDDTGKILSTEKFFQFAMHRSGELDPTHNIARAFLSYVETFEKKVALDNILPLIDLYTQAFSPTQETKQGLEVDRSIDSFVKMWLNNKKGRVRDVSFIKQGNIPDSSIRALNTLISVLDLGWSIPVGVAAFVGETAANFQMLAATGYARGATRKRTKKGKAFLKKYDAFIGRSAWEEYSRPGKDVAGKFMDTAFSLFHQASVSANGTFLLGSITKEEYDSGTLSEERLAELQLEMGRYRVVPGSSSIFGSTSVGKVSTKYLKWAIPPLRTLSKNAVVLVRDLKNKPKGEALTSREAREIYRFIGTSTTMALFLGVIGGDDDDDSIIGQLAVKARREMFTLIQSLNPELWLSTPRLISFIDKLGQNIGMLLRLEEYKRGKRRGQLKGVAGLARQFTPKGPKGIIGAFTED